MYALTQTPLGRMANAVRDNPERAEFVGYDTHKVRFLQLVLSAFFAGVSGGLSCINFEIVSAENVSALRSGGVLIATFIGGVPFFFGPILGAIVFILFVVALSGFTKAWLLYLGLFFVLMVLYAPGGLASLLLLHVPLLRARRLRQLALPYLVAGGAALLALAGLIGLVEMVYRLSEQGASTLISVLGISFDAHAAPPWFVFAALLAAGLAALHFATGFFAQKWGAIQTELRGKSS
jgi:branched-chain amino acid transport system permease protein